MFARAVAEPQALVLDLGRGGQELRVGWNRPALLEDVELPVHRRELEAPARSETIRVRRLVREELGIDADLATLNGAHDGSGRRSRFLRSGLGTMCTSLVARTAPCKPTATPPISTNSTPPRLSARRMASMSRWAGGRVSPTLPARVPSARPELHRHTRELDRLREQLVGRAPAVAFEHQAAHALVALPALLLVRLPGWHPPGFYGRLQRVVDHARLLSPSVGSATATGCHGLRRGEAPRRRRALFQR